MPLDILAFAAHPDDVEIGCSGTLIKLSAQGYKTGVVTLTRGEMGTRGNAEIRRAEFEAASSIMGLTAHRMLDIPDSNVQDTRENRLKIITIIREFRPVVVCAPYWVVRHPDHGYCSTLVQESAYLAGLTKIETGQERFRPNRIIFYPSRFDFTPTFIVDISEVFDKKLSAIKAHDSQFNTLLENETKALWNSAYFMEIIAARAKYWGSKIGVLYGEPFLVREPLPINDPVQLFASVTMI